MGHNKLLAPLGGKPLVRHAVEAALASRLDPVIVVTGHDAEAVKAVLDDLDVTFTHNTHFTDGLSASLRQGIVALPADCEGAMVLLGDLPGITAALIDRTIIAYDPVHGRSICVAATLGRRGHPVLWGRQYFEEIRALTGDEGARSLIARHADRIYEVETADDAPFADIDTPEALRAYSARLQGVL
jgi:molybdenum cofactor cytidylyltransferase